MTTKEMEKGFQEIWKLFKETNERMKETDERMKETDRKMKETDERMKETDERMKETDRKMKDTDKKWVETMRAVDALTGKWSKFVEGLIAPAAERLFKERGIEVDKVYQRVKAHKNGDAMEVDILAVNGEYAVLIEAKSTLKIEDVKEHIRRIKRFKSFFPEYRDRKVVGAVGGIVIDEESDKYAYKKGLFVIVESGENVKILNDKKFKPVVW